MKTGLGMLKSVTQSSATAAPPADQAEQPLAQEQLARIQQQLVHSQRLAALGTTAAMVAHEFNNLMTPVVGYAKYASRTNDPELMAKALETTLQQTEAALGMAERILAMASDKPAQFAIVSLSEIVADAHTCLCRDLAKDGITFCVDVEKDVTVWGDEQLLRQVFFNLLLNAREVLNDRTGSITVRARRANDEMIEVTVADTGQGIAPELQEAIFEPFFSRKTSGTSTGKSGSGLGLALCREIVENHRGTITVQSRLNKGTVFAVLLPTTAPSTTANSKST